MSPRRSPGSTGSSRTSSSGPGSPVWRPRSSTTARSSSWRATASPTRPWATRSRPTPSSSSRRCPSRWRRRPSLAAIGRAGPRRWWTGQIRSSTHLPGFALADPYVTANVTIQDMLSHRSGLPGAAGDLLEDLGYEQSHVLTPARASTRLNPMRTNLQLRQLRVHRGCDRRLRRHAVSRGPSLPTPRSSVRSGMTPVQLPALGLRRAEQPHPPCTSAPGRRVGGRPPRAQRPTPRHPPAGRAPPCPSTSPSG